MFDYLQPKDGPVVEGLEHREVVYAKDQPEYLPLRTLVSRDGQGRVVSRWSLTDKQRLAIAAGSDVFLELFTFGQALQPIRMAVSDGQPDEEWLRSFLAVPRPCPSPVEESAEAQKAKATT